MSEKTGLDRRVIQHRLPAVVVIHENRGRNPYIEDVARRLGIAGFIAFAPDALTPLGGYPRSGIPIRRIAMKLRPKICCRGLLVTLLLASSPAAISDEAKTVIGPSNIDLYDGANALMAGDGEEGVRRTLRGLELAQGAREVIIAHSNLCAGYLLTNQPAQALVHCNWVLERDDGHWRTYNNRALVYMRLERYEEAEEDIRKGQQIQPGSKNLKIVKGMYLDETEPVRMRIEVDDRRSATEVPGDQQPGDVPN